MSYHNQGGSSSTGSSSTGSSSTSGSPTSTSTRKRFSPTRSTKSGEYSTQHPSQAQRENYSPLESLIQSALTRAGNFSPARIDGQVMNMMLELANRVIEDVRRHPYAKDDIDYYTHQSETRPIPDMIMIDGLTAHYMIQQASEKAPLFLQIYQSNLSDILYQRLYGNIPLIQAITDRSSGTQAP